MDNYYEKLIDDLGKLMGDSHYQEAYTMLEEEFKMPYIPKEYENRLIQFYNECKSELNALKKTKKYNEDDIESLLFGSIDEACQAVDLLKGSNVRKHLDMIERYLCHQPNFLIRSLLIECLIEQDISDELQLDFDGLEIHFTPTYCELPQNQDAFLEALQLVRDYYENDNPSFLMMCVETMMKEMYFKMPFSLSHDEVKPFVYSILLYVYKANNDKEGFKAFISQKNLANYGGYDLLLYEYDV